MSATSLTPSRGDCGCGVAAILGPQQAEAGGLNGRLIETRRDQHNETRDSANVEVALGDRSGDHCPVREHQMSALPQHAGPLDQSPEAILEMGYRVNTDDSIESAVSKRQTGIAVKQDEARTIRQATRGCFCIGVCDSIRIDVEARQETSGLLNQCKRGQTTSTGYIEDMAILSKVE